MFKWLSIMHCSRGNSQFNRKLFGTSLFNCKNELEAGHELNYIHKELKNQSVYYFANLKDQPYQANVVLRGKLKPVLLNPHTGQRMKVAYEHKRVSGMETTTVTLPVEKHSSVFLIDNIL